MRCARTFQNTDAISPCYCTHEALGVSPRSILMGGLQPSTPSILQNAAHGKHLTGFGKPDLRSPPAIRLWLTLTHLTLLRCYYQSMPKRMPPEVREYLRSLGKKYGSQGGKKAAKNMTAEERLARAKRASDSAARKRTTARLARERAKKSARGWLPIE